MKRYFLSFCIMMILIPAFLRAEGVRGGDIFYEVDVARFKTAEDWTFLEIYFSIPRDALSHDALSHKKADDGYKASFEMGISIFSGDSLIAEKTVQNIDPVASLDEIKQGQRLFNAFSIYLKEGKYKLRTHVTDLLKMQGGWHEMDLEIEPFSSTDLALSDIQLSTNISKDTAQTLFTKNGFRVIPNPGGLYGLEVPILYYYCEIYNLSSLKADKDSSYSVQSVIKDMDGNVVRELEPKHRLRAGTAVVEIGKTNVAGLTSGNYQLQLSVTDESTGESITRIKDFVVYRHADFIQKGIANTQNPTEKMTDEFSGLTEEELDSTFELCQYIATGKEKKQYKKLDLNGKRNFLKSFWRQRDTEPLTEFNEYKQEYFQRVVIANARFSSTFKKGWKTDRGLVYIKNGEPDEIERHPYQMDIKAYEIWYYYSIEGGVQYIFVDIRGMGELQLVHSTARNEIHDDDWQRWLE
jgi:GWxTD domain-containing protein